MPAFGSIIIAGELARGNCKLAGKLHNFAFYAGFQNKD